MALSEQEQQIIEFGKENGKSPEQIKSALLNFRTQQAGERQQQETKRKQEGDTGIIGQAANFAASVTGGRELARGAGQALASSDSRFARGVRGISSFLQGEGFDRESVAQKREETREQLQDTANRLIEEIQEGREAGEDTTRLERAFQNNQEQMEQLSQQSSEFADQLPSTGQVLGSATRLAGTAAFPTIAGGLAGGTARAGRLAGQGATRFGGLNQIFRVGQGAGIGSNIARGAGLGATAGTAEGAVQGAGAAAEEGRTSPSDIAAGGVFGAGVGALTGGLLGGAGGALAGRAARKAQVLQELEDDADAVARFQQTSTGGVKADKAGREAVKQGIDESVIGPIKNATPEDKQVFEKMFDTAKRASKNATIQERPIDIVGETFVERSKHLRSKLSEFGKQVDEAAEQLDGQNVNIANPANNFIDELQGAGVRVQGDDLIFEGSDFEGIRPAQTLLEDVFQRINRADVQNFDAKQAHRLKRFIDNKVQFGKQGEGLPGQAETLAKSLRRNVDQTLDQNFTQYAEANDNYARGIELWDMLKDTAGKNFDPSDKFSQVKAGNVMRRVLGNSSKRGDIMAFLNEMEKFADDTGLETNQDLFRQTIFSGVLEDTFGSQASTGLREEIISAAQDFGQGQAVTGGARLFNRAVQTLRGVSQEGKEKAIQQLISQ